MSRHSKTAGYAAPGLPKPASGRLSGNQAASRSFYDHASTDRARERAPIKPSLAQDAAQHQEIEERDMNVALTKKQQATFTKRNRRNGCSTCGRRLTRVPWQRVLTASPRMRSAISASRIGQGCEAIRKNLKAFIDTGFTARHHVTEYWDAGFLKVFRGVVDMTPDDRSKPTVHPTMSHFFYMDEKDQTKVRWWVGAVERCRSADRTSRQPTCAWNNAWRVVARSA